MGSAEGERNFGWRGRAPTNQRYQQQPDRWKKARPLEKEGV